MESHKKKIFLSIEFLLLFFTVPLLLYFDSLIIHPSAVLLPVLIGIFLLLKFRTDFNFKELISFNVEKKILLRHILIIIGLFIILALSVRIVLPEKLFNLPKANPLIWIALCLFYPVFSAFAQEILYRTYIFRRYEAIFRNKITFILASAVSFSYVHIVYYSPVSIILTFFAGIYLAKIYYETRSVLFTSILHGIMGNIVFTVGLGEYFWLDIFEYMV